MAEKDKAGSRATMRQHLIDPEVCTSCFSCLAACLRHAIVSRGTVLAIDPDICADCGDCLDECPSGAIENWVDVPAGAPHSLEVQFTWHRLPGSAQSRAGVRLD